jgi:O-antigen/teichoic acid export membrane protein
MALVRNIALMGTSTMMRLAFGLLTFVVMARLLGPEGFGLVMLWLSVATLATLVANFGFTPYLLRDIGANPENALATMSEVLTAKILLSAAVFLVGCLGLFFIDAPVQAIFITLLIALLADAMTEFFNVGFRATNRFSDETRLASIAALIQFAIVASVTWWKPTAIAAATAFMVSRLLVLAITWIAQLGYFKGLYWASWQTGLARIKHAKAFATDFGLQSLFGQVDSLVLNHFLGPVSVGVYQVGMRLFQAGSQVATVLGNVFIPHVAAADESLRKKNFILIVSVFSLIGLAGLLVFMLFPERLIEMIFGQGFLALGQYLVFFGAIFFLRFIAAGLGCCLVLVGGNNYRAVCSVGFWLVIFSAVYFFGVSDVHHWLIYLICAHAFLVLAYAGYFFRIKKTS